VSIPTSATEPEQRQKEARIRRLMGRVADAALEGVQIEVAGRYEDYRSAFSIVHDSFVKLGYIQRQPHDLWFQPHHCYGRTTVFIAKREGRVVGTASVFYDGVTGLPVEHVYPKEASDCRSGGSVCEFGSLAVAPSERGGGLATLLQAAALYCGSRIEGAGHCLITVPPSRVGYYEAVFGFSTIRRDRLYHGFDRPAVLMHFDVKRFDEWVGVYADPPSGWHTVRSLMQSSSFPRTDFTMRSEIDLAQLKEILPAAFASEQ